MPRSVAQGVGQRRVCYRETLGFFHAFTTIDRRFRYEPIHSDIVTGFRERFFDLRIESDSNWASWSLRQEPIKTALTESESRSLGRKSQAGHDARIPVVYRYKPT